MADTVQAAVFGAGCWAQNCSHDLDGVACSVSGTGEEVVRSNLARMIGEAYTAALDPHEVLRGILVDQFWSRWLFPFPSFFNF